MTCNFEDMKRERDYYRSLSDRLESECEYLESECEYYKSLYEGTRKAGILGISDYIVEDGP